MESCFIRLTFFGMLLVFGSACLFYMVIPDVVSCSALLF